MTIWVYISVYDRVFKLIVVMDAEYNNYETVTVCS